MIHLKDLRETTSLEHEYCNNFNFISQWIPLITEARANLGNLIVRNGSQLYKNIISLHKMTIKINKENNICCCNVFKSPHIVNNENYILSAIAILDKQLMISFKIHMIVCTQHLICSPLILE